MMMSGPTQSERSLVLFPPCSGRDVKLSFLLDGNKKQSYNLERGLPEYNINTGKVEPREPGRDEVQT